MPRYLLATRLLSDSEIGDVMHLLVQRFPEVSVERRYTVHDDEQTREMWVCRAPSEAHVRRWAAAAELALETVEHIDAAVTPSSGTTLTTSPSRPPTTSSTE